jgi:DNA-binding HxlR family transcriptional regulator
MKNSRYCSGLGAALDVIGGKWKLLILHHLTQGTLRYGELRRRIPAVSDKVLIQQLKELQADELVARVDHKEIPPRVEYSLTSFGRSLTVVVAPLNAWGEKHAARIEKTSDRRNVAE